MGKRKGMRMTLPKKEKDLEKVVEEVMETHPEMAHEHEHHHHHELGLDELLGAIEVVLDSLSTRLKRLEDRVKDLTEDVKTLYLLNAKLYEAYLSEDPERRKRAVAEAAAMLEERASEKIKSGGQED